MDDLNEIRNVLEAALLVAGEPLTPTELAKLFDPPLEQNVVRKLLDDIRSAWSGRAVELTQVASGWRFRAKPDLQPYLDRLSPEKPPRYSRVVMETLGHSQVSLTLNTYSHVLPMFQRDAAAKMDAILSK